MFFDPLYILLMLVALVLSGGAAMLVKGTFAKYKRVPARSGVTGAQAARIMLDDAGLRDVAIQQVSGYLSDHYDPRHRVLRLSPEVYGGRSVAALGVACHEAGHAVQHATKYSPLVIRNAVVPMAGFGSNVGLILIILGLMINFTGLSLVGLVLFGTVVFFQVVNLPVEFNASTRAKQMLPQLGLISGPDEQRGVNRVLNAAAMTYLAATLVAILHLLYYASLVFGGRRN